MIQAIFARLPEDLKVSGRFHSAVSLPAELYLLLLTCSIFVSCNQPFQPVIDYKPKLVMYSILFANESGVYVRLSSTTSQLKGDVTQPLHGASVTLVTAFQAGVGGGGSPTIAMKESYTVTSGDTDYYYYAPVYAVSGMTYGIEAEKEGYDSVSAFVTVPRSFVTIPDINTYSALRFPDSTDVNPNFDVSLSGSSAYFVQLAVEYRGFDSTGNFRSGFVDATGSSPANPFSQVTASSITFAVSRIYYSARLAFAKHLAGNLKQSHFYADIIVTQLNDPLYRFYLTSGRWNDALAMRTDKVVFSNVTNGQGVVGAAAVDTTRIFLF